MVLMIALSYFVTLYKKYPDNTFSYKIKLIDK